MMIDYSNALLPVSETLFIPLAARAAETTSSHPVIMDDKSVEIMQALDLGGKITNGGMISTLGILARTKIIDEEVQRMLNNKPAATIINLGAGLDTRICRMDNGLLTWYDLDLPEVIQFRRQFFSENERIHFIAQSALDETWMDRIPVRDDNPVILIAEGLLMYFSEAEVVRILGLAAKRFPGAHLFADVVHSYFIQKKISSPFLWGMDHAKDIEKLDSRIRLVQAWSAGDLLKHRQPLLLRMLNILPATKNRSQILHIQFRSTGVDHATFQ